MGMVDRVAFIAHLKWAETADWHSVASAAIEAMREPTDRMVAAADQMDAELSDANLRTGGPGRGAYMDDAWRAMIDAALSENAA